MSNVANLARVGEKNPVGSKVLERNVFVSNSEIMAEKEQPDHEVGKRLVPFIFCTENQKFVFLKIL